MALNEVTLLPGFNAMYGSDVDIAIQQIQSQQMMHTSSTIQSNNDVLKLSVQQAGVSELSVFPNPTSNVVYISCGDELVESGEILVFSQDGVLLKKTTILGTVTEMSMDVQPGVYIFAIRNTKTNGVSSYKIIKR